MRIRDQTAIWLYLILINSAYAQEIMPLQRPPIAPENQNWTDNLPKATFILPKPSEYREIPPRVQIPSHSPSNQNFNSLPRQINPAPSEIIQNNSATSAPVNIHSENAVTTQTPAPSVIKSSPQEIPALKSEPLQKNPTLPSPSAINPLSPLAITAQPQMRLLETIPSAPDTQSSSAATQMAAISSTNPEILHIKKKPPARIEKKALIFWRVQIAAGNDLDQLREYRQSFNDQYGKLVQDSDPIILMDKSGHTFRLQLKPLVNQDTAQRWCLILKEHGHDRCRIIKVTQFSPPTWQVQIIAKHDLGELQEYQKEFISQYTSLLKGYKLAITLSESGEYFRLRVKSLPNESLARQICLTIKNQGADCFVTKKADIYAF